MRDSLFFCSILLFISIGLKGQGMFSSQQIISTEIDGGTSIDVADLDGDGDKDVLSASWRDDKIAWYENDGNSYFKTQHIISLEADYPSDISATDIDNDGDMDVVSVSSLDYMIAWYENDGFGNFSELKVISTASEAIRTVYCADLDNDGDVDVLSAITSLMEGNIFWHENDGGGNFGEERVIGEDVGNNNETIACDLDGDGDLDVLAALGKIIWHKNDGDGNFGTQIIIEEAYSASDIFAGDLDEDGDMDIVFCAIIFWGWGDQILWLENDGNGNFGSPNMISDKVRDPAYVHIADLDNDGDMDVLSASWNDDKLAWYENNGNGNFGRQQIISLATDVPAFLYADDIEGDGDVDILSLSGADNTVTWYRNLLIGNVIEGFVFLDDNGNGVYDESENPLPNQGLLLEPSETKTFTDSQGNADFFTGHGNYQLTYEYSPYWDITSQPEIYDISFSPDSELPIYHFGFMPIRRYSQLTLTLNSTPTRCSQEVTYWLHYANTGTNTLSGVITLEVDELMEFIDSNPKPITIDGRNLMWDFDDVYSGLDKQIQLQFQMPNEQFIGENLVVKASTQLFTVEGELLDYNSIDYGSELLCSYDPNDKLARSNLLGQSEFAYIEDTIFYTVRFQNTGNDTAFNIRIEDVLDKKLDWTTFYPITASHDYRTELNRESGKITFYFDDILLPDSTTNEVESHGFVTFGIASLENIEDKTEVENTAEIFFDFNPAIVTNTSILTLIQQVETSIEGNLSSNEYSIEVYPNPFSDFTTIEVKGLKEGNYLLELVDIFGKKIAELKMEDEKLTLKRGELKSGMYLFRILAVESKELVGSGKVFVE